MRGTRAALMRGTSQPAVQLLLLTWMLLPGCGAVRGPGSVSGVLGGTLSIACMYDRGDEMRPKFWCTPGLVQTCDTDIVITKKDEPVVRRGRFSIWDNRARQTFMVTVENLTKNDAGIHLCGVRTGLTERDKSAEVEVIVSPAPISSSTTLSYTPTIKHLSLTSSASVPTQTSTKGNPVEIDSTQSHDEDSNPTRLSMVEYILIPGMAVVVLSLAVAVGVLVALSRKRKKALSGAAVEMDGIYSMSHTGGDALTYMDINHHSGTAESQLYGNAEAFCHPASTTTEYAQVKLSRKCLEEEKEVTYASVQDSLPEQQEIYANVPAAPRPREELYSKVQTV